MFIHYHSTTHPMTNNNAYNYNYSNHNDIYNYNNHNKVK